MYERVKINSLPNMQNVLSIYYIDKYGNVFGKNGNKLKTWDNGHGYLVVSLKMKNQRKWKHAYIHRLVGLAFVENTNKEKYTEIDHIDTDKQNNYYKNLRWVNRKENMQNPITKEKMQNIETTKCYVYDYLLNYIGEFKNVLSASKKINHDIKKINCRVVNYFILEDRDLNRIIEIDKNSRWCSVVVIDMFTREKKYFYSTQEASKYFHGKVNITQAIQKNWTVRGHYKIRKLNYKKRIKYMDV